MTDESRSEPESGKGRDEIYRVVIDWFRDKEKGKVLDVPAGYGFLAKRLADMGYSVSCGEINTSIFKAEGIQCVTMDITERIPYPDGTFDYVACIEGLEHTTNPYRAVSELSRVLREGGYLIVSTPNYCNLEKRIKFLITGYLTKPKTLRDFIEAGNLYDFHNSPLTITVIDFIFQINGLTIVSILKDKLKRRQLVLYPLYLILKFANLFISEERKKNSRTDLTLHKNVILGGNTLILIAKKGEIS